METVKSDPERIAADDGADSKVKRKRKFSTRSRSGCQTCKERRIRCDEKRPRCNHCLIKNLTCVYAAPSLPLKERKALETSTQPPWQDAVTIWQIPEDNAQMDPFEALPLKMTNRSKELFYYFSQCSEDARVLWPQFNANKSVRIAAEDPLKFRSSLLLSGLHYVWKTGNLGMFATTYLSHLNSAIHTINMFLGDPKMRTTVACTKLVFTVCILEAGTLNITAADAHVRGLMSMMDYREQQNPLEWDVENPYDAEGDILDKYMLVAYNFTESVKARLLEQRSGLACWRGARCAGNRGRINNLLLSVYFLNNSRPRGPEFRLTHAGPYIDSLRNYHRMPMIKTPPPAEFAKTQGAGGVLNKNVSDALSYECGEGERCVSQTRAMVGFIRSLIANIEGSPLKLPTQPPEDGEPAQLIACWNGIFSSTICYNHACLAQYALMGPIPVRVLRRLLIILLKDLYTMQESMEKRLTSREFWFWRAYVGLAMLKKNFARWDGDSSLGGSPTGEFEVLGSAGLQNSLMTLQRQYNDCFRLWSDITGVKDWAGAKAVLQSIVWQPQGPSEEFFSSIWDGAMASRRSPP